MSAPSHDAAEAHSDHTAATVIGLPNLSTKLRSCARRFIDLLLLRPLRTHLGRDVEGKRLPVRG